MNIDTIKPIESVLLCKLNRTPIGELPTSCVASMEKAIDEVSKITLKINKYMINQNGKTKIENPMYYEIKNKRYLLINDEEYYIIDTIKESKISGVKEVTALGGEQILVRRPTDIEDIGIQLVTEDVENDVYSLNTLLGEVGWKLAHVDNIVAYETDGTEKMRWQESINGNMLEFIKEDIAQQFDCLPIFDAKTREISLYDMNSLGEDIQLCLTKDNYLKSKEKTKESDDLITVLKLRGNEELDVARYIIGGYDFITNFSYFIETGEMSNELINTLAKYDEMVGIRHVQWLELTDEKVTKEKELNIKRNQWQMTISNCDCYKRIKQQYYMNNDTLNEAAMNVKLSEESDKELILRMEITQLLNDIDLLQASIDNLNLLCRYETCTDENGNLVFNQNTLSELQEFIFVDIYEDDSFVDANALIEKGKSVLSERCKPTLQIEVDSINFLSRIIDNNFRLQWNGSLSFGDIIILIDEDTNEEEFYYFIGYNIDYHSNSLNLIISNKKSRRDNAKSINKWLKTSKQMNSLLINNKYLFNKVKHNRLNIDKDDVQ